MLMNDSKSLSKMQFIVVMAFALILLTFAIVFVLDPSGLRLDPKLPIWFRILPFAGCLWLVSFLIITRDRDIREEMERKENEIMGWKYWERIGGIIM